MWFLKQFLLFLLFLHPIPVSSVSSIHIYRVRQKFPGSFQQSISSAYSNPNPNFFYSTWSTIHILYKYKKLYPSLLIEGSYARSWESSHILYHFFTKFYPSKFLLISSKDEFEKISFTIFGSHNISLFLGIFWNLILVPTVRYDFLFAGTTCGPKENFFDNF